VSKLVKAVSKDVPAPIDSQAPSEITGTTATVRYNLTTLNKQERTYDCFLIDYCSSSAEMIDTYIKHVVSFAHKVY
jgi:hypothetical protein